MPDALTGILLPCVLLAAGVYLGVKERFFYIFHPVKTLRETARTGGKSSAKALTVALAGTLGVGNISGVATAIYSGGAGAVFWMWVSAFAVMGVKYAEVCAAVTHRRRGGSDGYYGGAPYYIKDTVSRAAGTFFALLLVINSLLTGNSVQVSAAAEVFPGIPHAVVGLALGLLAAAVTLGGLRRLSSLTFRLIPLLSLVYTVITLAVTVVNRHALPGVFREIFRGAFDFRAAGGGVLGFGVSRAVKYGAARGVFSNEAGCGTSPSAHASADVRRAGSQGCFGILEVFIDTVLLCTLTAVSVLSSGVGLSDGGVATALAAVSSSLGRGAGTATGVCVVAFAFATVISQSYYGISAAGFIFGSSRAVRYVYVLLSISACLLGAVMDMGKMWAMTDVITATLAIFNTFAVVRLVRCEGVPPPFEK